jgi:biopolymer transport protein ExbB
MNSVTFIELMKTSIVVMPLLLVASILLVTYGLERLWYYLRAGRINSRFLVEVKRLVRDGKVQEAVDFCDKNRGLVPEIVKAGLNASHLSRIDAEDTMESYKERSQNLLKARLGVFGTISFIAPLLGLLGTVLGIMRSFHDLALSGSGGPTIIAAGIAEALVTTVAGISVAVPSAIMYNYFTTRLRNLMVRVDTFTSELIILLYGERTVERRRD